VWAETSICTAARQKADQVAAKLKETKLANAAELLRQ
jgi:hypothetical protein